MIFTGALSGNTEARGDRVKPKCTPKPRAEVILLDYNTISIFLPYAVVQTRAVHERKVLERKRKSERR